MQTLGRGPAQRLTVGSAAVLYIGAVLGPALLIAPGLATQVAGPASIVAWVLLVALCAPLAAIFCVLGVRYPLSGGVAHYARVAFGDIIGAATGWCFVAGVLLGAPTMAVVGGQYVTALIGGGSETTLVSAGAILACVLAGNAIGLQATSRLQTWVVGVLGALLVTALITASPKADPAAWSPFAPHGYMAVGRAANLLMLCFIGWEALSSLTGRLAQPRRDLPRAIAASLLVVSVLYLALAVVTISTTGTHAASTVPLADLMSVGLGPAGRDTTAVIATLLTFGTVNAYVAGACGMAASLATEGLAPRWLGGPSTGPSRRLLTPVAILSAGMGCLFGFDRLSLDGMVSAASALFIAVYVAAMAAAARLLRGRARATAIGCFVLMLVVLSFSGWFALLPLGSTAAAGSWLRLQRSRRRPLLATSNPGP